MQPRRSIIFRSGSDFPMRGSLDEQHGVRVDEVLILITPHSVVDHQARPEDKVDADLASDSCSAISEARVLISRVKTAGNCFHFLRRRVIVRSSTQSLRTSLSSSRD